MSTAYYILQCARETPSRNGLWRGVDNKKAVLRLIDAVIIYNGVLLKRDYTSMRSILGGRGGEGLGS